MLADPERSQRKARCICAIENVFHSSAGVFSAGALDHCAPPAAAGKQGCTGRRQQRYRPADGKCRTGVRQIVNDDRGMMTYAHGSLITDICLTFK